MHEPGKSEEGIYLEGGMGGGKSSGGTMRVGGCNR